MPMITRPVAALAGAAALMSFTLWDWFFRPVGGGVDAVGYILGRDFVSMWAAPWLAATRGLASLTDMPAFSAALSSAVGQPGISAMWSYPPTALLLLLPFSLPPYWPALALWTALGWALYLLGALAFRGARPRAPALLLLAASPAAWIDAGTGQNGFFTAALLLGGLLNLSGRPALAGLLFGLMTFKPQMGIALAVALVALRAWRAVAAAALTTASLVLASVLCFGIEPWRGYITVATPFNAHVLAASASGHRLLLASLTSALIEGGLPLATAMAVQAAVAVLVLAALWVAARRTAEPLRLLALVAAATPLVSPYIWTYDLVALGAALALRFLDDPGGCRPWILAAGYLAPAFSMLFEVFPGVATAPWLLAAVFAELVREALAPGRATAGPVALARPAAAA